MEYKGVKKKFSSMDFYNIDFSIENFKKIFNEKLSDKKDVAVILASISNLKHYNYVLGYEYGDYILENVFDKINNFIKKKGIICRFGGDTLLILLYEKSRKNIIDLLKGIINDFNDPIEIGNERIRILFNMGIVQYPRDSKSLDDIFKYAEIALDYSQKDGQDIYRFFTSDMYENNNRRWELENDVLNAISNEEFILYYQPQVDISKNKVCGAEVLLRWNHPKYGVLTPINFIDSVEENGTIREIGKFIFSEVCNEINKYKSLVYDDLKMSINISEKQLSDDSFLDSIKNILKESKINGKFINIEMTERLLVSPTDKTLHILKELRNMGIGILIDDFGTKYSSLNYLCNLPITGIKIDKSFIDKISNFDKEFIVIKHIINLAHELGIEVIAEGVEYKEQLDCLININCNKIQGFIFGKPMPLQDFIKLVTSTFYLKLK
ncbi:putative bifunctional diguanylate cyclase/phosphodiesterase [Hathewaya limosa]|uniref:Diguanylate cyclase (GGDEF)-like protein n=1 Tax=Hathewaya limosa TaxID=1536 RepID=A0ABU0JPV3_HATLI|nr:bifunctional diguanylate cyclase/phosphodiesterase [Hathewaya limosa]MDQ0479116.1 diguanylate cyclase (GGDEF)-like protein [Hathewaya limosa]